MSSISDYTSHTILIVDDDPDARLIVSSALSVLGLIPIEVSDGTKAIELFSESLPDLVILDMMMPGLNGNEVCQRIKKMNGGQHVPVIMLTARDSVQDKVEALDCGADDYLTKPFHYQELQARVRALLRVRELNVRLMEKNQQLEEMQKKLVEQERQLLVMQLAGTAAHKLGQPLSAILLNCYLLEHSTRDDEKFKTALAAVKSDIKAMATMIEQLKSVDARQTESYYGGDQILEIGEKNERSSAQETTRSKPESSSSISSGGVSPSSGRGRKKKTPPVSS